MRRQLKDATRSLCLGLAALAIVQPVYAVDGVTEINAARAAAGSVSSGDAPGFPVTLSRSGSYRLTGNLSVSNADTTVIEVTADDVTLDLNGFEISCGTRVGPCAAGNGDGVRANQNNVTVINGTVRHMGSDGIVAGVNARIERVRALNNHRNGAGGGNGSMLLNNTANGNGNDGLGAGVGSTISGNTTRDNDRGGIETSTGCTISGNTANDNNIFGIYCNGGCTIDRNTTDTNGTGISLLGGNSVIGNTARGNTGFALVSVGTDTGYTLNVFTGNNSANGGANAPQVSSGTSLGQNFCGTDQVCP